MRDGCELAVPTAFDDAYPEPEFGRAPTIAGWGPTENGRFLLSIPTEEGAWISCDADSVLSPKR